MRRPSSNLKGAGVQLAGAKEPGGGLSRKAGGRQRTGGGDDLRKEGWQGRVGRPQVPVAGGSAGVRSQGRWRRSRCGGSREERGKGSRQQHFCRFADHGRVTAN